MSALTMREEFEAWINIDWKGVRLVRNPDNAAMFAGQYQEDRVHVAWKSWQASRAALVIELPAFSGYQDHIVRELQAAFTESVEAAGLKVAP